jgi:pectate lyase
VTGNLTVTVAGTVIQDQDRNGCITVKAANVTIRNSRITCPGYLTSNQSGSMMLIEDTILQCQGQTGSGASPGRLFTLRRVEVFGCENNVWCDRDCVIEDSYIHDPIPYNPVTDPHTDSIQIPTGATNILIDHNTVYGGYLSQSNFGNSAITNGGNVGGVVINNNLLAGGGYTVYCEHDSLGTGSPAFRITNNRFSRVLVSTVGGFGPSLECRDEIQSGNVYHETGAPLSLG